ncbi:hypothetical protein EMCRGX_G012026 [Ephydatia muelleri]
MEYCFVYLSLVIISLGGICRSQIIKAPNNQIVSSNGLATFNCSMSCSQLLPVTWYLTLPTNARTAAVSPFTSLSQVKNIYGIEVTRGTVNECSQGGYYVEQLFVKAQQQLNLMPVQCSTVCLSGDCSCDSTQVYFSKLAVLNVLEANSGPTSVPSSTKAIMTTTTAAKVSITATTVLCPTPSLQVPAASASGLTSYVTITVTATTTVAQPSMDPTASPLLSADILSHTPSASSTASYLA